MNASKVTNICCYFKVLLCTVVYITGKSLFFLYVSMYAILYVHILLTKVLFYGKNEDHLETPQLTKETDKPSETVQVIPATPPNEGDLVFGMVFDKENRSDIKGNNV